MDIYLTSINVCKNFFETFEVFIPKNPRYIGISYTHRYTNFGHDIFSETGYVVKIYYLKVSKVSSVNGS